MLSQYLVHQEAAIDRYAAQSRITYRPPPKPRSGRKWSCSTGRSHRLILREVMSTRRAPLPVAQHRGIGCDERERVVGR